MHQQQILVTTMNDVPGYEVVGVYGEVFGLVARARNVFSNIGAGFRTITGGEAKGYTKLLSDSRDQAVDRLREAAAARGGNAVIAMRFDCNEIADMISEVAAYGTAVVIRPVGQQAAAQPAAAQQPQAAPPPQAAPAQAAPAAYAQQPAPPQEAYPQQPPPGQAPPQQ